MKAAEATELRGKLIFSNSQTYGEMGALAYYQLGLKAKENGSNARISKELRWALLWWTEHVSKCKARIIRLARKENRSTSLRTAPATLMNRHLLVSRPHTAPSCTIPKTSPWKPSDKTSAKTS